MEILFFAFGFGYFKKIWLKFVMAHCKPLTTNERTVRDAMKLVQTSKQFYWFEFLKLNGATHDEGHQVFWFYAVVFSVCVGVLDKIEIGAWRLANFCILDFILASNVFVNELFMQKLVINCNQTPLNIQTIYCALSIQTKSLPLIEFHHSFVCKIASVAVCVCSLGTLSSKSRVSNANILAIRCTECEQCVSFDFGRQKN